VSQYWTLNCDHTSFCLNLARSTDYIFSYLKVFNFLLVAEVFHITANFVHFTCRGISIFWKSPVSQKLVMSYVYIIHKPVYSQAILMIFLHGKYMYVCMYIWGVALIWPSALRPSLIYCASPLISPLWIPHFEWNVGLCLWGHHKSHLVPRRIGPGDEISNKPPWEML
jgi:hypothetical protein